MSGRPTGCVSVPVQRCTGLGPTVSVSVGPSTPCGVFLDHPPFGCHKSPTLARWCDQALAGGWDVEASRPWPVARACARYYCFGGCGLWSLCLPGLPGCRWGSHSIRSVALRPLSPRIAPPNYSVTCVQCEHRAKDIKHLGDHLFGQSTWPECPDCLTLLIVGPRYEDFRMYGWMRFSILRSVNSVH